MALSDAVLKPPESAFPIVPGNPVPANPEPLQAAGDAFTLLEKGQQGEILRTELKGSILNL